MEERKKGRMEERKKGRKAEGRKQVVRTEGRKDGRMEGNWMHNVAVGIHCEDILLKVDKQMLKTLNVLELEKRC